MGEVGAFLEDLVRIPSPTGEEHKALDRFADEARDLGFELSRHEVGNVLARQGSGDVHVLLAGHVDTVPGQIPVRREDGVLHGRGAVDAKGPLASFLHGAADPPPGLTVTVAALVGEEGRSRGCRHLLSEGVSADHVVVGEPSGADGVAVAYRGDREVELTVEREGVHPAHPDPNAAGVLVPTLAELQDLAGPGFDELGVHVRSLDAGEDGNASRARARVSLRFPDDETWTAAASVLDRFPGRVDVLEEVPPVRVDRTAPVVTALVGAIRGRGVRPRLVRKTGTCDMNLLQEVSGSICAYGPGDSALDHAPDERVPVEAVETAVAVIDDALRTLADGS